MPQRFLFVLFCLCGSAVSAHEMYLAYSTFLSLSVPLRVFDELYGDLKGNAHIGVIGKIHY